jgi:hypothetical protein
MEQALNGHRAHLQAAGHLSIAQALQHDELNHLPLAWIQTLEQGLHRFPLFFIPFDSHGSLGPIEVAKTHPTLQHGVHHGHARAVEARG